ncbi:hypothetical protein EON79_19105 [bacterium]|nr:MAG: hypothetical protein EON79_19105 [bacterium]
MKKSLIVPLILVLAASAMAKKDKGAFTVILPSGQKISGEKVKTTVTVPAGSTIQVRGRYQQFDIVGDTFGVRNQSILGFGAPRLVFLSRTPQLAAPLTSSISVEINKEQLVLRRTGSRVSMKIQAKDISQGGMFQMEPGQTTRFTHVLSPDFSYYVDALNRVLLTDTAVQIRESPQTATLVTPLLSAITGTRQSTWLVQAGGRMGMVVGEDATQP